MDAMVPVITIDGPGGAGKGTVSRILAERLGWHYLDSGRLYRAIAALVMERGVAHSDSRGVLAVAKDLLLHSFPASDGAFGVDDAVLSSEACGRMASVVAAEPEIRRLLRDRQRDFRRDPGLVADGRDMGSVIFPDAVLKVYLTASSEERASRRFKQLKAKGLDVNLPNLIRELQERDQRDRDRRDSPLLIPEGAIVIDSTDVPVGEVVQRIETLYHMHAL